MPPDALGDSGDMGIGAERDREAAGAAQEGAVGAEPAGRAAARQAAVATTMSASAQARTISAQATMWGVRVTSNRQRRRRDDVGGAQIGAAGGVGERFEVEEIGFGAARFGERVAHVIPGTRAQQSEPAILARKRDGGRRR